MTMVVITFLTGVVLIGLMAFSFATESQAEKRRLATFDPGQEPGGGKHGRNAA